MHLKALFDAPDDDDTDDDLDLEDEDAGDKAFLLELRKLAEQALELTTT